MYIGCYDASVKDLGNYRLRLEELARLGFRSVGLAINWEEHPANLGEDEKAGIDDLVKTYSLEVRLHPDLAYVWQLAQQEKIDLLVCARRELEPVIEWGLRLNAYSICCDSIRPLLKETVEVFKLMLQMSRGPDLKFGVENSQKGVINSPERLNQAVEMVDDSRMGVLIDTGHINTTITNRWNSCTSPEEFLSALDVPIWDTHLQNNSGKTDGGLTVRDSEGTIDIPALLRAFHAIGYTGGLLFECKRGNRTFQQIEKILVEDKIYLERIIQEISS